MGTFSLVSHSVWPYTGSDVIRIPTMTSIVWVWVCDTSLEHILPRIHCKRTYHLLPAVQLTYFASPPYFLVGHRPMLHAHIADDEMEGHFISALDWNSTFSCVCLRGIYSTSFCFLLFLLPAEVKSVLWMQKAPVSCPVTLSVQTFNQQIGECA